MTAHMDWHDGYRRRHLNPLNRTLNWICIPQISFAILIGLKCVPIGDEVFNPATAAIALAGLYYLRLSRPLGVLMLMGLGILYAAVLAVETLAHKYTWWLALAMFIEAWASQLIGEQVEGASFSIGGALRFMLIGPLWLMADLYERCGGELNRGQPV